jgi:hypothetical protein
MPPCRFVLRMILGESIRVHLWFIIRIQVSLRFSLKTKLLKELSLIYHQLETMDRFRQSFFTTQDQSTVLLNN